MKYTQEEYKTSKELRKHWNELFENMKADEIAFVINSYYLEDNALLYVEYQPEKVRRTV